ncbi:MAG: SAM-dependent methyltransferase, partial [Thermomicrobiales bacterium]
MVATIDVAAERRDALATRIFNATIEAMDLFSVYLGDRLGFYRALAEGGPATSGELADRTGSHDRYVREWLEQQAVTGILEVDDQAAPASRRQFR